MSGQIPLVNPEVTESDRQAVQESLLSGKLSAGARTDALEQSAAELCGRPEGVAVCSGGAAMHVALSALEVGEGDEVILSPFDLIATASDVIQRGAKPVFVDIDPISLNLDPDRVTRAVTDRTRAVVAAHTFGNPSGMDRIAAAAASNEVPLIEETSNALGTRRRGKPTGSFGRVAVVSFSSHRPVTCGEGGMILTDDNHLAAVCRSLRDHGHPMAMDVEDPPVATTLTYERLGCSCRISEVNAALGVAQLERLEQIMHRRQEIALNYFDRLMDYGELILPTVSEDVEMCWPAFVVRLTDQFTARQRDRILMGMGRHDIGCTNPYPPVHLQNGVRERLGHKMGDFPVAESVAHRTIALPFFNRLDATQVELVSLTLRVMLQRESLLRGDAKGE